jgi:hypothetical protein
VRIRIVEIRPFRGGWKVFESKGVEPFWTGEDAKRQVIGYTLERVIMILGALIVSVPQSCSHVVHKNFALFIILWLPSPRFMLYKDCSPILQTMSQSTIQPELVSLQGKLAGEIEKDEKEHELIGKRIEKNRELLRAVNASLGALLTQATGFSTMTDTIRAAINALKIERFTAPDVERSLTQHFPTVKIDKESVRTALWNMMKKGEINCTRKGNNRQPAEYERTVSRGGEHRSGVRIRRRTRPDAWKSSGEADDLLSANGEASK